MKMNEFDERKDSENSWKRRSWRSSWRRWLNRRRHKAKEMELLKRLEKTGELEEPGKMDELEFLEETERSLGKIEKTDDLEDTKRNKSWK